MKPSPQGIERTSHTRTAANLCARGEGDIGLPIFHVAATNRLTDGLLNYAFQKLLHVEETNFRARRLIIFDKAASAFARKIQNTFNSKRGNSLAGARASKEHGD